MIQAFYQDTSLHRFTQPKIVCTFKLWYTNMMNYTCFSHIATSTPSTPSLLLRLHRSPPPKTTTIFSTSPNHNEYIHNNGRKRRSTPTLTRVSSDNQTVKVASPTTTAAATDDDDVDIKSASDVVRNFYTGINGHDLASVEDLIAEDCVYEDLVFPRPFVGRKAILEFFKKFIDSISKDLQFVIDDISNEDSSAIGVTWHLAEWKGRTFPFSKGCSFYRLDIVNGKRQIIYGRDSVEPSIKPGEMALAAIRGVTWLLRRFPQLADQL